MAVARLAGPGHVPGFTAAPGQAPSVVQVDTTLSPAVNAVSWAHTCNGVNRYLVVRLDIAATTAATSATYNGVAMTLLGRALNASNNGIELWGLANPAVGAHTVSVTISGPPGMANSSTSFTNVNQGAQVMAGVPNTGASTTITNGAITGLIGDLLVDGIVGSLNMTVSGTGHTQLQNDGGGDCHAYLMADGTSQTPTWTQGSANAWGSVVACIRELDHTGIVSVNNPISVVDTGATITGDTIGEFETYARPVSDTGTTNTVSSLQRVVTHSVVDTGTTNTADTVGEFEVYARTTSDTLTFAADTVAAGRTFPRSVSDTGVATITEAIQRLISRGLADTGRTGTDSVGEAAVHAIAVADTGTSITDTPIGGRAFARATSDTGIGTITELITRVVTHAAADTGTTNTTSTIATLRSHAITDTLAFTDSVVGAHAYTRSVSDTGVAGRAASFVAARGSGVSGTTNATCDVTLTGAIASGNLAVVAAGSNTQAVSSVADNSGLGYTWTVGPTALNGTVNAATGIAVCNCASGLPSGTVVTVTYAASATRKLAAVLEYTSGPIDTSSSNGGAAGVGPNSGSPGLVLIATEPVVTVVCQNVATTSLTQPAGFTKDYDISVGASTQRELAVAHLDTVASGSQNPAWSGQAAAWECSAVGLLAPTSIDSVVVSRLRPSTASDTGVAVTETLRRGISLGTASTGATITDTAARGAPAAATDTGTTSSSTILRAITRGLADTGVATITEAFQRLVTHAVADTGRTGVDSVTAAKGATSRSVTDTLTFTDTLALARLVQRGPADSGVTVTEALTRVVTHSVADTGTTNTTSSVTAIKGPARVVSDTLTFAADTIAQRLVATRPLTDTGTTITMSVATAKLVTRTLTDTGTTNTVSTVVVSRAAGRPATDTLTFTDTATRRLTAIRQTVDAGAAISDTTSGRRGAAYTIIDTGTTITSSVLARRVVTATATDTGVTLTDTVLVSSSAYLTAVFSSTQLITTYSTSLHIPTNSAADSETRYQTSVQGADFTSGISTQALYDTTGVT